MRAVLKDLFTGRMVELRLAELEQQCKVCGKQMQGKLIFRVERHPRTWRCAEHLENTLMMLESIDEETT